eukprot:2207872-Amphidinium_carterae.1
MRRYHIQTWQKIGYDAVAYTFSRCSYGDHLSYACSIRRRVWAKRILGAYVRRKVSGQEARRPTKSILTLQRYVAVVVAVVGGVVDVVVDVASSDRCMLKLFSWVWEFDAVTRLTTIEREICELAALLQQVTEEALEENESHNPNLSLAHIKDNPQIMMFWTLSPP